MDQLSARQSDTGSLEREFQVVDQLSARLSDSYEQLQQKVAQLTRELSETRQRHIRELKDKERLAHRLYRVLEALPAAVIVIDNRDRIDQFNPIAEILFPDLVS